MPADGLLPLDRLLVQLAAQPAVVPGRRAAALVFQFAVAGQPPLGEFPLRDGLLDGAARLGGVRAVGEPAAPGQFLDLRERLLDPGPGVLEADPRNPGVSMSTPPPGSGTSSRLTVVCRPLPCCWALTAPVRSTSAPSSALPRVDLPAPETPSSTTVPVSAARSASIPAPLVAATGTTSTPGARASASSRSTSGSGLRSALVRAITGRAPLSQARATSRSSRSAERAVASGTVMTMVSTLAASVWASEVREAPARTMAVRRGSSASIRVPRSAAQSPVHGSVTAVESACSGPSAVTTSQRPRSTRTIRAGVRPAVRCAANCSSRSVVQPKRDRSYADDDAWDNGGNPCGQGAPAV